MAVVVKVGRKFFFFFFFEVGRKTRSVTSYNERRKRKEDIDLSSSGFPSSFLWVPFIAPYVLGGRLLESPCW